MENIHPTTMHFNSKGQGHPKAELISLVQNSIRKWIKGNVMETHQQAGMLSLIYNSIVSVKAL